MEHKKPSRALAISPRTNQIYDLAVLRNIFPDLSSGRHAIAQINLNDVIYAAALEQKLDCWDKPAVTQRLIDEYTARHNLLYTYGGWMECRDFLWQNTYMRAENKFIHLGVDINVPAGIAISSPLFGRVIHTDYDGGSDVDWGTSLAIEGGKYVYIFAHLAKELSVKEGDIVHPTKILGTVGTWPDNGNVFNHLHIQAIPTHVYKKHKLANFVNLDGYGRMGDERRLSYAFPNPLLLLAQRN